MCETLHQLQFGDVEICLRPAGPSPSFSINDGLLGCMELGQCFDHGLDGLIGVNGTLNLVDKLDEETYVVDEERRNSRRGSCNHRNNCVLNVAMLATCHLLDM